jgi:inhibitor of KinA sporulation pathway (predicted exonuclease)
MKKTLPMRIEELVGFPKPAPEELTKSLRDYGYNEARDQARQAVEEALSVERIFDLVRRESWFSGSRKPTHNNIHDTATAIRKSVLTELFGEEK